jgi:hypothetical protein
MVECLGGPDEIVSEYKDEIFEYMRELQVRIFSLIPALLLIHTNYPRMKCFPILTTWPLNKGTPVLIGKYARA